MGAGGLWRYRHRQHHQVLGVLPDIRPQRRGDEVDRGGIPHPVDRVPASKDGVCQRPLGDGTT